MTPWSHLENLGVQLQLWIYTLLSFSELRVCPYARLSVSRWGIPQPELKGPKRDPYFFPHTTVGSGEYVNHPASRLSPGSGCRVTNLCWKQSVTEAIQEALACPARGKTFLWPSSSGGCPGTWSPVGDPSACSSADGTTVDWAKTVQPIGSGMTAATCFVNILRMRLNGGNVYPYRCSQFCVKAFDSLDVRDGCAEKNTGSLQYSRTQTDPHEGSANVWTLAPPSPCAWTIQWGGGASSWTECPPGCSCSLKSGRLPAVPCTMPTPEVPVGTRRVTASRPLCWCILPLWHCLTRRPQQHHATRARSVAWSAIPPGALASWYGTWPKQSTTLQRSPSCPGDPPTLHGGVRYNCHHRTWAEVGPL